MNVCFICGSNHMVELHHIIHGRGKRREHENDDSTIYLCYEHHRGTKGVHGRDGHELDIELKLMLQNKYFDQGLTEDEVRVKMGGKIYGTNENLC